MSSKRIAIIDHVGCKAGMDAYSGALAQGFADKRVDCFLFSNFEELTAKNFLFFRKKKGSLISSIINQVVPFWKAGKICKHEKVEECIVHLFSYDIKDVIALRILKLFKRSVIGIVHDVEHLASKSDIYREKILTDYCKKIMVHNSFSKENLLKQHPTLEEKIKVIPHPNFHKLPQGKDRSKLREKWKMDDKKYLLFFGQIKDAKGLDVLLNAVEQMAENVHLIIAGKVWQTSFNKYQKIIDRLKIQNRVTTYLRFITDEERDELFTACDAIVLPYKKIFQSGVMQVAMSYKIPIISSDIAPFRELIGENKAGFLFKNEDAFDLSQKIKEVFSKPEEAIRKSEYAHEMAATDFSNEMIANELINW